MVILSIDTSCDETAAAVTSGRKILSNAIYSQILIHKKWGGVVPHLAKRAHEERINLVIEDALKKAFRSGSENFISREHLASARQTQAFSRNSLAQYLKFIDYIAVTYGPGLAPALEVGILKAKELAKKNNKKLIPINHMEGHIYSCFAQNSHGNPEFDFLFPYLCLLVSGGHTELVLFKDHTRYEVIGKTIDDAAGEALDKAAKMLGLGYPGGPVIEALAERGDPSYHIFPRPMRQSHDLNYSFSGLKTSFFYHLKKLSQQEKYNHVNDLAASYQLAVFDSLIFKLDRALDNLKITTLIAAGGVMANGMLRQKLRQVMKKRGGTVLFPKFKKLYGDNAAMIGIAAFFKAQKKQFVNDIESLDRVPRLSL